MWNQSSLRFRNEGGRRERERKRERERGREGEREGERESARAQVSNHASLRFRNAAYRNIRELALSYVDDYMVCVCVRVCVCVCEREREGDFTDAEYLPILGYLTKATACVLL